ncbi:hypothetical protein DNTS_028479 [Danionella cerebrum]|uniref:NSL1 component of MIS12 kinetochore complex n=1 Tax=Danionella cerebrum TaxID=2873325 RepID=A0A553R7F6_9TELE|nr:hypothetical protein DNTS_028479 [Danionella translucida]
MEDVRENGADFRVNVKSKKLVFDQLEKYKELFKGLLDGQCQISEEDKAKLLQEMVVNFELTVQENLVVGGLSWDEASEDIYEDEKNTVNDILDEKIVETANKRSLYPKQIRNQVVRSLRAERKLLDLYEQAVKPQEIKPDPDQEGVISSISAAAPTVFKQASTALKSLKSLKQAAEGLRQVIDLQPSVESVEVYREVFGSTENNELLHRLPSSIRRADCEYSRDYVPADKVSP